MSSSSSLAQRGRGIRRAPLLSGGCATNDKYFVHVGYVVWW